MSVGSRCPEIKGLKILKGHEVEIPSRSNQVVVVECWASWCGPCRQAFPHVTEIYHKYKARGLEIIGVTSESGNIASFVQQQGANMDYNVAIDEDEEVTNKLTIPSGARGIPHAFVIGRDGVITYSGHPMDPQFVQAIESALSKQVEKKALPLITASEAELTAMPVKDLKAILTQRKISLAGLAEKSDLVKTIMDTCRKTVYYE